MKYAIIEDGGKQYRAIEGGVIEVDYFASETGEEVNLERVLLVADGETISVGKPLVSGAVQHGQRGVVWRSAAWCGVAQCNAKQRSTVSRRRVLRGSAGLLAVRGMPGCLGHGVATVCTWHAGSPPAWSPAYPPRFPPSNPGGVPGGRGGRPAGTPTSPRHGLPPPPPGPLHHVGSRGAPRGSSCVAGRSPAASGST